MSRVHPSNTLLASYATGELALAPALLVSAHLDGCRACRHQVSRIEDAEGRLLESLPGAPVSEGALARTLERLEDRTPEPPTRLPARWLADVPLPRAIAHLGVARRRFLSPGLWVAPVPAAEKKGWRVYILHAPARTRIPTHEHRGPEMVAVLTGAFTDGRTYREGDFTESAAGASHELRVTSEGPCASLIATKGGSKWQGFARMLTPLLGV